MLDHNEEKNQKERVNLKISQVFMKTNLIPQKKYKILKIPFFTSHTNRDENHLVGECMSK